MVGTAGDAPVTSRSTARDRYDASLGEAPAADAWRTAGRRALRERLTITPSFREIVHFSPDHQHAVGYRLPLKRGQRVTFEIEAVQGNRRELFVELFEEMNPPSAMFRHRFSMHADARSFDYEARSDGEYVVRLQPRLNGEGTYRVVVRTAAGLTFPVLYANLKSIGSYFGDPRDGGKRDHEGVDIFAPRGTQVVAVAGGTITAVRTTPRGGRVVWQRDDERDVTYYYAHLQDQSVREGQRVSAGDPVGTVGNTGNAQSTPPHLHFAVYRPGQIPLDPVPFLYDQPAQPIEPVLVDLNRLGSWLRVTGSAVRLRSGPSMQSSIVRELNRDRVLAIGGVREWQRVMLEDGTTGFVAGRLLD